MKTILVGLLAALLLSSAAHADRKEQNRQVATGVAVGALIGSQVTDDPIAGALVGGVIGGVVVSQSTQSNNRYYPPCRPYSYYHQPRAHQRWHTYNRQPHYHRPHQHHNRYGRNVRRTCQWETRWARDQWGRAYTYSVHVCRYL